MTRREAAGLLLAAALLLLGRLARRVLLLGPDGAWRDPGWLEEHLPPLEAPEAGAAARRAGPRRPSALLDPNTCHPDSLQLLPGVGPALASRIVEARQAGVHFASARDLQVVRGIGPRLVERIGLYLVFTQRDTANGGGGGGRS